MADFYIDDMDRRILDSLYDDSKGSQKRLSAALGISEPSITKRKRELEGKGIIKNYSVNIGYDRIGYVADAVTLVKLKVQKNEVINKIAEELRRNNAAIEVYTVFGDWDIFVRWLSTSPAEVSAAVQLISENENVQHTETVQLTTQHKRRAGPILLRPNQ